VPVVHKSTPERNTGSVLLASPTGSGVEQLWRQDAMDALLAQHATGWLRRSVRL
jgi:hypothetical protein